MQNSSSDRNKARDAVRRSQANMFVSCIMCLDEDPPGVLLQCDEGHVACRQCYETWVQKCDDKGKPATCPECRVHLASPPVRNRAMEATIAKRIEEVRREVQEEDAAATQLEVANALATADQTDRFPNVY